MSISHTLPELTVDDLRILYRDFDSVYRRHVDEVRFDVVKGSEFTTSKKRLIAVCHLLEKYPELTPGKRTELIQAVLSEDNLQHAQQVFPKSDRDNQSGKATLFSKLVGLFSVPKETDEDSLRKELKKKTSGVSDSNFLLQLKGIDNEDLEAPIRTAVDLACGQLSYSIDSAVKKMTHAVLRMQQEECQRSIQREIETEERKVLSSILADFIQVINKVSAGRRPS